MRVSGLLGVIGPTSAPTGRGVCSCRCWRSCRARIAAACRLLQKCREATPAVAGSPSPTASYAFPPWVFESTSGRSEAQQQRRGLLRSEEHTSELQSQSNLVCRLLLEKKKQRVST